MASRALAMAAHVVVAVALAGCGERVPPTVALEEVAADLLADFQPQAALASRPDAPVAVAPITPGDWMRGDGPRPALTMPAPARVRFRVTAPPDAVLRFAAGVGGIKRRQSGQSGVRFTVLVDGATRWERTVNPSATRHDRRWFEERIPLGGDHDRPVEIELVTALDEPTKPAPGMPGWSRIAVARRREYPRRPADPSAPNLLVLLVDTLRADRVGQTPTLTPTLDALGGRGLVFERAYAQASWTLQSVPSLMTGLLPASHGVRGNFWGDPDDDHAAGDHVPDALETWAEAATRAGVTTVGVSANPLVSRSTNLAQGFETFHEFGWDPEHKRFASASEVNAVFLEWLRAHAGYRFVGYLHYMEPHDPYTPPAAARPAPPPGIPEPLARGWVLETGRRINFRGAPKLPEDQVAYIRALYDEEVRAWDASLRDFLAALERSGVLSNTVIVVTSDHGEEFQEHGYLRHGQHLHDELVRVPLVIAGPGIPAGRRSMLVQGVDLFPTLAHVLGLTASAPLPGRNLLDDGLGDAEIVSATSHAIAPDGKVGDAVALRQRDWLLVSFPATGTHRLFDLAADPAEQHDRWATGPTGPRLASRLGDILAAAPVAPRTIAQAGDLRQRLRALGYAE